MIAGIDLSGEGTSCGRPEVNTRNDKIPQVVFMELQGI